jgi:hypothetical protein
MPGVPLRKAHAYSLTVEPEGKDEADYLSCCHCQHFWKVVPGSGNTRGWCANCGAPHCGGPNCWTCTPFMKKIEQQEQRQKFFQSVGI